MRLPGAPPEPGRITVPFLMRSLSRLSDLSAAAGDPPSACGGAASSALLAAVCVCGTAMTGSISVTSVILTLPPISAESCKPKRSDLAVAISDVAAAPLLAMPTSSATRSSEGNSETFDRPADPQTIAGRRLDLGEQAVAQLVGGDEQRSDEDDDGANDGDGRKAEERNPHVPLRRSKIRLVNELRANPKIKDKEAIMPRV